MIDRPDEAEISRRAETWTLVAIVAAALLLRLVRLGVLSDAGDEETTTLGAMALLRGFPPTLPGGAIYIRELPFSFIEAGIFSFTGLNELALRLVPALVAAPRVIAMAWLARPFVGRRAALLCAALLAVTPLDFELSRIARMYSPFATLDLIFITGLIYLTLGKGRAALVTGTGLVSLATHVLTVTHAPVAWAAAFGRDVQRRRKATLVTIGLLLAGAFGIWNRLVEKGYDAAGPSLRLHDPHGGLLHARLASIREVLATPARGVVVAVALLAAAAVALPGIRRFSTSWAKAVAALAILFCLCGAPVVGGALLLSVPVLERISVTETWRRIRWSVVPAIVLGCMVWFGICATAPTGGGIGPGLRFLLGFPYPNWFDLIQAAPLLSLLGLAGILLAIDRIAEGPVEGAWIGLIVAALGPPLITGLIAREDALRYEVHVFAPMIVLGVLACRAFFLRFSRSSSAALALAGIVMVVAVRPDQTVRAMLRGYGPVAEPFAVLNVAPDHRGAAEFVRAHAKPEEWIVAEDMLEQYLYIGRTEVWLRRWEDAAQFLQGGAADGIPRDVYVGAMHARDLDAVQQLARARGVRALWLITSAEVEAAPRFYRTTSTEETLESWRPLAWYVGEDRMTRVYYVVDGKPVPDRAAGEVR